MSMHKKHLIEVKYAVLIDPTGDRFIAYAPHLNLMGFGRSAEEALLDFDKALDIFFAFHQENRNLHQKLISLGFKLVDHKSVSPENFTIPTHLIEGARLRDSGVKKMAFA